MPRITTAFGRESTAAEVAAGIDLSGRRVDRHRRRLRHRRRDRPRARRRRRRRHARRAQHRGGRADRRRHHRDDRQRRRARAPPRPRRSGVRRRVRRRLARPAAHPRQQRRRDGLARARTRPRAGSCSSRPTTSATSRSRSACTRRSRRPAGAHRRAQLERAPALAGRVRGHPLRAPRVRPVARPTASRRRPTCCSPSRRRGAGPSDGITANALMPGAIRTQPAALRRERPGDAGALGRGGARRASLEDARSRAPRPRCWSRPRRCSRASAAATSRTATRQPVDDSDRQPAPACAPTRSTRGGRAPLGGLAEHARDAGGCREMSETQLR